MNYENESVVPTLFSKIWPPVFFCQEAKGEKVQAASDDVAQIWCESLGSFLYSLSPSFAV